ncbi:unnamed protein product, partial [marine sediment metagenome]
MHKQEFYERYFTKNSENSRNMLEKDKLILEYLRENWKKINNLFDIGCLSSNLSRIIRAEIDVNNYYGTDLLPDYEARL